MTAPQFARCRCGHAKVAHERGGLAPQCIADRCTCLNYRPDAPLASTIAVPPRPGSLESILQDAKRSQFKRTVALAEKIAAEIADLRGRLADEARKAEAQQNIAVLQNQLAKPSASPGPSSTTSGEQVPCPEPGCDRTFSTLGALGGHRWHIHGKRGAA